MNGSTGTSSRYSLDPNSSTATLNGGTPGDPAIDGDVTDIPFSEGQLVWNKKNGIGKIELSDAEEILVTFDSGKLCVLVDGKQAKIEDLRKDEPVVVVFEGVSSRQPLAVVQGRRRAGEVPIDPQDDKPPLVAWACRLDGADPAEGGIRLAESIVPSVSTDGRTLCLSGGKMVAPGDLKNGTRLVVVAEPPPPGGAVAAHLICDVGIDSVGQKLLAGPLVKYHVNPRGPASRGNYLEVGNRAGRTVTFAVAGDFTVRDNRNWQERRELTLEQLQKTNREKPVRITVLYATDPETGTKTVASGYLSRRYVGRPRPMNQGDDPAGPARRVPPQGGQ